MDYPKSVPNVGLVGGRFVDEDMTSGVVGSLIPSEWGNAVTEEILNVIESAGVAPEEGDNSQLLAAIRLLAKTPVWLTDTGSANAYAAANEPPLSSLPASGYIQQVKIANANTGASTYAPDGLAAKPIYGLGLQPLQGGEMPTGLAALMYLVQTGINGGNGAWILMRSVGGGQQVAPATKSQHALQLVQAQSMFSSPIGAASNVKMTVNAASAASTLTADEIIVGTALGGQTYRLSGFNKAINLATTGAGGMDAGAAPANGFVALYAIFNPATGASALLAVNATAALAPTVYGGTGLPAGYTASALVTVVPTSNDGRFKVVKVFGRNIGIPLASAFSTTSSISTAATSIAGVVPPNAVSLSGELGIQSNSSTAASLTISSDAAGTCQQNISGVLNAGFGAITNFSYLLLPTPQMIFISAATTAGVLTSTVYVGGYTI